MPFLVLAMAASSCGWILAARQLAWQNVNKPVVNRVNSNRCCQHGDSWLAETHNATFAVLGWWEWNYRECTSTWMTTIPPRPCPPPDPTLHCSPNWVVTFWEDKQFYFTPVSGILEVAGLALTVLLAVLYLHCCHRCQTRLQDER